MLISSASSVPQNSKNHSQNLSNNNDNENNNNESSCHNEIKENSSPTIANNCTRKSGHSGKVGAIVQSFKQRQLTRYIIPPTNKASCCTSTSSLYNNNWSNFKICNLVNQFLLLFYRKNSFFCCVFFLL